MIDSKNVQYLYMYPCQIIKVPYLGPYVYGTQAQSNVIDLSPTTIKKVDDLRLCLLVIIVCTT
jgi:hypothetical protein